MISIVASRAADRAAELRASLGIGYALTPAIHAVESALLNAGLGVCRLAPDDPLLAGADGVLDRQMQIIWIRANLPAAAEAALLAHELAHWCLHRSVGDFADLVSDLDGVDESIAAPIQEADGYSPMERRELEASAFAAEFIAPCQAVAAAFAGGATAQEIAGSLQVPERVVMRQLVAALLEQWTPRLATRDAPEEPLTLDAEQAAAATARDQTTVVVAGPGSGKTRALAARVLHLLDEGVSPARILAVTFSRNAAEELRQRLQRSGPDEAAEVGVFTLHGYGLELLRRFGRMLGLPECPLVCDRITSLRVLEEIVRGGAGGVWEHLDAPVRPLAGLLDAIGGWKENGLDPDTLSATDQRKSDAVRLYRAYEQALRERGGVDYADLITLARLVLREIGSWYPEMPDHVLVDEFQDMDSSSLELLRLVAADGRVLWAVGDPLQAIYAFRGAETMSPIVREADDVKPRAMYRLTTNYRSTPLIVRFISALGVSLGLPDVPALKPADSGEPGRIVLAEADDDEAELSGLAQTIREAAAAGVTLGGQAVLCRTNQLARGIAQRLRAEGVAVNGPLTALDQPSARAALSWMARAADLPSASDDDATGGRPPADLQSASTVSAMLARYLFGALGAARGLSEKRHALDRQAMLWLLGCAQRVSLRSAEAPLRSQVSELIGDVRRCVALGEDHIKGSPDMLGDSVNVMTIHAAKGLEFDAVYVPRLNAGVFPPRHRKSPMDDGAPERDAAAAEARLLYVAASRARRWLVLSCRRQARRRASEPSQFWKPIREAVQAVGGEFTRWTGPYGASAAHHSPSPMDGARTWSLSELRDYEGCPYRYALSRERERVPVGGYAAFVHAMRRALRALQRSSEADRDRSVSEALAAWQQGMRARSVEDGWEQLYEARAREMLGRLHADPAFHAGELFLTLLLPMAHGCLSLSADCVIAKEDGAVAIERFVYRARRDAGPDANVVGVLYRACRETWPHTPIELAVRYLDSGERVPVQRPSDDGRRAAEHYDGVMRAIRERRFAPKPGDHCAWCAHLLVCPRVESRGADTTLD